MSMSFLKEILHCEECVWQALVDGDQAADAAALHDDFLGVYSSGFAAKDDHVNQLAQGPTITSYQLLDARTMPLGEGHVLLSYKATFTRASRDNPENMYVSSIWKHTPQGWVNVFSQDTPADPL